MALNGTWALELTKEYFRNLNEKNVCDIKTFWKTVKPFLSDKIVSKEQIPLAENNEIISKDSDVALILSFRTLQQILNFLLTLIVTPT